MQEIKIRIAVKNKEDKIITNVFILDDIALQKHIYWLALNAGESAKIIARDFFVESKNGNEYYVNDIVEVDCHYDGDVFISKQLGIVKYSDYSFEIMSIDDRYICSFFDFIYNYGSGKIGNIHENPELLGSANEQ